MAFKPNAHYRTGGIEVRGPRPYERFGIEKGKPIYRQFAKDLDRFLFVSQPALAADLWEHFEP